MSSVHSQTSEVDVPPISATKLKGGTQNGSDTSIVSVKSTITFEKQKVVPRTRTMSVQSVLSSFSLRSMINNRDNCGSQQQNCDEEECTNTSHNHNGNNNNNTGSGSLAATYINPIQQIQSPAMASTMMKKRNGNGGKHKQTLFSDLPQSETRSRIGQQLPFTDDKRKSAKDLRQRRSSSNISQHSSSNSNPNSQTEIEHEQNGSDKQPKVKSKTPSSSSASSTSNNNNNDNNNNNSSSSSNSDDASKNSNNQSVDNDSSSESSPIDSSHDSESEEDDISRQNKLTTDALRKLSMIQHNREAASKSIQTTPLTSSENLVDPKEPLTQLTFGGKNVILDTSTTIRKNSVAIEPAKDHADGRKQSLEIITQPTSSTTGASPHNFSETKCSRSGSSTSLNSKRLLQQINEPKKPMYMPAVLRDISETNITIDTLKSHSPAPSDATQSTLQAALSRHSNNSSPNYARSVHSTTSSIMSSYRNKIQSWLSNDKDPQFQLAQPTREHWVPDSKRLSCKYCHKMFSFWERKHHCRHCGDIYCQQHVMHWLYLNPKAKFIIGSGGVGVLSKICNSCLEEYENLVKNGPAKDQIGNNQEQQQMIPPFSATSPNSSYPSNDSRQDENNAGHSGPLSNLAKADNERNIDETLNGSRNSVNNRQHLETVVGSVPADWSWSSF